VLVAAAVVVGELVVGLTLALPSPLGYVSFLQFETKEKVLGTTVQVIAGRVRDFVDGTGARESSGVGFGSGEEGQRGLKLNPFRNGD
jgi:hypothetical protein